MRLILVTTHLLAMLLPLAVFFAAFGWLVAEPPVEIGPLIFTCEVQPLSDGSELAGCYWATR